MDIPKYIGLFLLKNDFCYLPGIGNLEIKRISAGYNSATNEMNAPKYELVYTQAIGSIDDQFANFIANNERISIVHAANSIREFCADAKQRIQEGHAVEIPAIGKFTHAGGNIQFIQDANLHIEGKSIPFFKTSTRVEEVKEKPISEIYQQTEFREPKADEEIVLQSPQVNWGKILLIGLLALLILGGAGFLFWYYSQNNKTDTMPDEPVTQQTDTSAVNKDTSSLSHGNDSNAVSSSHATGSGQVIINEFNDQAKAEKRLNKLKSYGHNVSMVQKDSAYFIVMPIPAGNANQQQYVDSLKRLFGGDVRMMQ